MNQELPKFINHIISNLRSIEGITAIALGGSRARGNHTNKSDVDLGIYYSPENPPDLIALNRLACQLDGMQWLVKNTDELIFVGPYNGHAEPDHKLDITWWNFA